MSRRRVVVTGLGIISPVGNTVPEAWEAILAGKSGITRVTRFDASRLSSQIAGEVKGFDIAAYLSPKEARRMDNFIHYGMAACLQAWRDSGLALTPENAERIGINFGSGIGGLPLIEAMHGELKKSGPRRISPFFIPGTIIKRPDPELEQHSRDASGRRTRLPLWRKGDRRYSAGRPERSRRDR